MGIKKGLFRLSLILLAVILMTGGILPSVGVAAANVVKIEKTYDIVVAYDNSGSMYNGVDYWCKAKFAMEIFASMMDFENGDKLTIFPMWEVVTDGSKPAQADDYIENEDPIEIRSVSDINKISNMYSLKPGSTPISVVDKAAKYLRKSNATDKWLIVLTDGAFDGDASNMKYNDQEILRLANSLVLSKERTEEILKGYASKDMKLQYFLLGEVKVHDYIMDVVEADEKRYLYSDQAKTSDALQEKLIGICNKIFQRDELTDSLFGKSLTLDISMKSLIVFVQGEGAKINSLITDDENKTVIDPTSNSGQRKFSEYSWPGPYGKDSAGTDYTPKTDRSLYGQVVTFGECAKGKYTLDITGADRDKIKIFYEPDVDMTVEIKDLEGNPVDIEKGSVLGGQYKLYAKLIDAKTGEDITKSPLMGNNVKFDIEITEDGKSPRIEPIDVDKGSTITLNPGSDVGTVVTGTYLKDYKISSEDDSSIFPNTLEIIDPEDALKLKAEVLQPNKWYQLSDNKKWKPIRVDLLVDGEPLTDEQLKAVSFDFKALCGDDEKKGKSLLYKVEPLEGESAVNVYLAKDENGKYKAPSTGEYDLTITASLESNKGDTLYGSDKVSFNIQILPLAVVWAIAISGILFLILLLFLILNQKVLPNHIECESTVFKLKNKTISDIHADVRYSKRDRTLSIATPTEVAGEGQCYVVFKLVPIDKLKDKSKNRRIRIVDITSENPKIAINSYTYERDPKTGRIIDPLSRGIAGGEPKPISRDARNMTVDISTKYSTLSCKLRHK